MAPPDPIQTANASYPVSNQNTCSPSGEALFTPAAAQQASETSEVIGVQDDQAAMSYARPVSLHRQPIHVFDASPLQVQNKQKRVLVNLGDALQIWINQEIANANPVDSRLEELAQLLHAGRLPDANDPDFQELINQSFSNTALDTIIHAIALEADTSPNRTLHAQALRFSLQYFCQHNTENPADRSIRQSLVTALSHSSYADSRSILSEVSRNPNTPTNIQQQIQSAFNTAASYSNNIPVAIAHLQSLTAAPHYSALHPANMLAAAQVAVLPSVPSVIEKLGALSLHRNHPILEAGSILAALPRPANSPLPRLLLTAVPLLQSFALVPGGFENISYSKAPFVHSAPLFEAPFAKDPVVTRTIIAETEKPIDIVNHTFAISPSEQSPSDVLSPRFLQLLGLGDSSIQNISGCLPSPFVTAFAAMMGGAQYSTLQQTNPTAPLLFSSNTYAHSAYSIRPVGASASTDSGQDGFGESREGFSQGHSHQGSGEQNPDQNPQDQAPPADIYLTNLA